MLIHDLDYLEASKDTKVIGSIGILSLAGANANATGQFVASSVVASTVSSVVIVKYRYLF